MTLVTMVASAAPRLDSFNIEFVRGVQNAEDLVRLPGTPWVVASHFNVSLIQPHDIGFGPLEAVRIDTHEVQRVYPAPGSTVEWDPKTYPDCATPPSSLSSHGLNVRALPGNGFRLYVVNHGGRESVEVIDVAVQHDRLLSKWRGCIPAPAGFSPNAVAPLPDGGIALSGGGVATWRPGSGWKKVDGLEGAPNGVEVSRDGRWLFVAIYDKGSVLRIPLGRGDRQAIFKSKFLIDNLRWGEDGHLYFVGQRPANGWRSVQECVKAPICDMGFVVASIDPSTWVTQEVFRSDGIEGEFGGATTALQVEDRYWIGTFHGDRIAIVTNRVGSRSESLPNK